MTYSKKESKIKMKATKQNVKYPNVLLPTNGNGKRYIQNDQHWYLYHMKMLQNVNRNLKVKKFKHVGMTIQMYNIYLMQALLSYRTY
jgi:hypothetical protein